MADKERSAAKRIAIFNHKGGVGKTTLTVNVAHELSQLGKRVLLVDADPQCNLTAYLLSEEIVDDLLDNSDGESGRTVWTALKPLVDATGDVKEIEPYELSGNKLFVIPGDIRLSEFEAELNAFLTDCVQRKPKGFRGVTALSRLINNISLNNNIDYVLYDAGPNIGPLNRIILLDCDHLVISMGCDLFSIRALKTLGRTLSKWVKEWRIISDLAPVDIYLLPGKPLPIGYIIQRFRTYGGVVASQPAKFLSIIEKAIRSDILKVLKGTDQDLINEGSGASIGEVKDFGGSVAEAQAQGKYLGDINVEAKDVFSNIAKNIIKKTS